MPTIAANLPVPTVLPPNLIPSGRFLIRVLWGMGGSSLWWGVNQGDKNLQILDSQRLAWMQLWSVNHDPSEKCLETEVPFSGMKGPFLDLWVVTGRF